MCNIILFVFTVSYTHQTKMVQGDGGSVAYNTVNSYHAKPTSIHSRGTELLLGLGLGLELCTD